MLESIPISLLRLAEHPEFDKRLDVKDLYVFGYQSIEQFRGLGFAGSDLNLLRLIGQFKEMGGVDAPLMAITFTSRDHCCAWQPYFSCHEENPLP